jgi:hypothetical protein
MPVDAEPDRLAMIQRDDRIRRGRRILDRIECTVVEDRAVLIDLYQRAAAVRGGRLQNSRQVLAIGVDGPRNKRRFGTKRQRNGLKGLSRDPIGVDLVILPISEVGEY